LFRLLQDFSVSQEITTIKNEVKRLLQEKFVLDDLHYAATFLCPNTRNLKLLDNAGKERARGVVVRLLDKIAESTYMDSCMNLLTESQANSLFET